MRGLLDVVVVIRNFMIILCRQREPCHRIPVGAKRVFLFKKLCVLDKRLQVFLGQAFALLMLIHVAEFLFPVAFGVKQPVRDSAVT